MKILGFFIGVLAALQLPNLPAAIWLFIYIPVFLLFIKFPALRIFLSLIAGFLWVVLHGHILLSSTLSPEYSKRDLIVQGVVASLPERTKRRVRFVFDIKKTTLNGNVIEGPDSVRLSWYGKTPELLPNQEWQFMVRLKQPNGMLNPGSFDYERWLFERGIRATGYVKKSEQNVLLEARHQFISANEIRQNLRDKVMQQLPDQPYRGVILALLIGDRSQISEEQWKVFTATGTNHLVAISGLHIGLVAGSMFFLARFVFRRAGKLLLYLPAQKFAAIVAIFAAAIYAMLAGFAIPTQRALVMTCVVMLAILLNKRPGYFQLLLFALFAVLLIDPFSVLSTGFWLSFIAVAAILYAMQGRVRVNNIWWQWGRVQWVVTLSIAPVLLFVFQTFSLISPLANLIAVPWVSFLVVPFVLLAGLFSFITPVFDSLLWLSHSSLEMLWWMMDWLSRLSFAQWQQFSPVSWTLLPAALGIVMLLAPRGFPAKYLGILFCLPLFFVKPNPPSEGEFKFTLLDVGQGLSAIVQTKNHVLVYDTGPKFSETFNTGEAVVIPFLKTLAIDKVDKLIISHGDNDHIGGMRSVLSTLPVNEMLSGVMDKTPYENTSRCHAGQSWEWDGVEFEMLHPEEGYNSKKRTGNNGSCVLKVTTGSHSVLLTGDIEKSAERHLLKRVKTDLNSTILIAPHHGSNTSSTGAFIEAISPQYVLFPASHGNRFGFPKDKVIKRYEEAGVEMLNTGDSGAIIIEIKTDSYPSIVEYREQIKRFWHRGWVDH